MTDVVNPMVHFIRSPRDLSDYGDILHSGMILDHTADGRVRYGRTGSYVPPIVAPLGVLIVTDTMRKRIEDAKLTGISLRPVVFEKAVLVDWKSWGEDEAQFRYPSDLFPDCESEPEDYILEGPHSPDLAARIGLLWEGVLYPCRGEGVPVDKNSFRPSAGLPYCDDVGAAFLARHAEGGVDLERELPPPVFFMRV